MDITLWIAPPGPGASIAKRVTIPGSQAFLVPNVNDSVVLNDEKYKVVDRTFTFEDGHVSIRLTTT